MEVTKEQWDGLIEGLTRMYKKQEEMEKDVKAIYKMLDTTGKYIEKENDSASDKLDDIQKGIADLYDAVQKIQK